MATKQLSNLTAVSTHADADIILIQQNADGVARNSTWTSTKAFLKTYFDTLYSTLTHKDRHKSGGADAFAATDVLEAITKRIQESAGPTTLALGAVTDGEFLKRSGTTLIGSVVSTETLENNVLLNAFRIATIGSLAWFYMQDGVVDEYEDETGIDTGASTNESYDATNDLYSPLADTVDANTKLLLHCNGADGGTSFPDSGATVHTVTANGNAATDVDRKKFGTAAGLFDGTGDFLNMPSHADWSFGTGNFTFDAWVYCTSVADYRTILGSSTWGDATNDYTLDISTGQKLRFITYQGATSTTITSTSNVPLNQWVHIAVVRSSGTSYMFIDGVDSVDSSAALSGINVNLTNALRAGSRAGAAEFVGSIDEIRVSNSARWTTGFTPPSIPYGNINNMTLISNNFTAVAVPTDVRVVLFEQDVDTITLNTDLKAWASRDGGTTYTQITLADEGNYESGKRIIVGTVSITAQPSGTTMKYKVETLNNKNLKVSGIGFTWK